MSDKDGARMRKRVLIGAGSFAEAEGALRLVEAIARLHAAELHGLLLSELATQEMAQAFGGRVVSLSGHIRAAPTGEQIRHLSRGEERAFRQALARLAEARGASWSFESRTGELSRTVSETFAQWDFFVVARQRRRMSAGRVVLLHALGGRVRGEGRRLAELLGGAHSRVVELALPDAGAPAGEAAEAGTAAPQSAAIGQGDAALLILDLAGARRIDEGWLRRILDAARCPVLILGPGAGDEGPEEGGGTRG